MFLNIFTVVSKLYGIEYITSNKINKINNGSAAASVSESGVLLRIENILWYRDIPL